VARQPLQLFKLTDRHKHGYRALRNPLANDLASAAGGFAVSVAHGDSRRPLGMSAAARLLQQV
jgi:hypothetical protein